MNPELKNVLDKLLDRKLVEDLSFRYCHIKNTVSVDVWHTKKYEITLKDSEGEDQVDLAEEYLDKNLSRFA